MKPASRLALGIIFFTGVAFHVAAQERSPFYGNFEGKSFDGDYKMTWIFGRRTNDGATVINIVIRDGNPPKVKGKKPPPNLGQADGINVKLEGDKLEFELKWSPRHKIKGPADAKYVATIKGNDLLVKWTAGDEKGEITAVNTNPVVIAKKDDKKDDKKVVAKNKDKKDGKPKAAGERVYLSDLMDDRGNPTQKGTVTQLGVVIVGAKSSKAQFYKVTTNTKFVVVDGEETKTYDQKTVLADAAVRAAFRERYVMLERQGTTAVTVTATAPKKKN